MDKDFERIFSQLDYPEHAGGLYGRILLRIENEKRLAATRRRIFWFSFSVAVSLPLIILSWINFESAAAESGLWQLFSLALTDFSTIAPHYKDFLMSLTEALPIFSTAGLVAGIFLLMESSAALIKNAKLVYKWN